MFRPEFQKILLQSQAHWSSKITIVNTITQYPSHQNNQLYVATRLEAMEIKFFFCGFPPTAFNKRSLNNFFMWLERDLFYLRQRCRRARLFFIKFPPRWRAASRSDNDLCCVIGPSCRPAGLRGSDNCKKERKMMRTKYQLYRDKKFLSRTQTTPRQTNVSATFYYLPLLLLSISILVERVGGWSESLSEKNPKSNHSKHINIRRNIFIFNETRDRRRSILRKLSEPLIAIIIIIIISHHRLRRFDGDSFEKYFPIFSTSASTQPGCATARNWFGERSIYECVHTLLKRQIGWARLHPFRLIWRMRAGLLRCY